MQIKTALEISDACTPKGTDALKIPQDIPVENVIWALRRLAGAYRRQKQLLAEIKADVSI